MPVSGDPCIPFLRIFSAEGDPLRRMFVWFNEDRKLHDATISS